MHLLEQPPDSSILGTAYVESAVGNPYVPRDAHGLGKVVHLSTWFNRDTTSSKCSLDHHQASKWRIPSPTWHLIVMFWTTYSASPQCAAVISSSAESLHSVVDELGPDAILPDRNERPSSSSPSSEDTSRFPPRIGVMTTALQFNYQPWYFLCDNKLWVTAFDSATR